MALLTFSIHINALPINKEKADTIWKFASTLLERSSSDTSSHKHIVGRHWLSVSEYTVDERVALFWLSIFVKESHSLYIYSST